MTDSASKTPSELASGYARQIVYSARASLALRRYFPGAYVRFKRAASSGPNAELALIFTKRRGQAPEVRVWRYSEVEALAVGVTDAEALAELDRHAGLDGEESNL